MDDGGPLIRFKCGTLEPECLYGIASFSNNGHPQSARKEQSFFTDAVRFKTWIYSQIIDNL